MLDLAECGAAMPSQGGSGLDEASLREYVFESNAIEDLSSVEFGPGTPEFDRHLDAARLVAAGHTDDYRAIHGALLLNGGRMRGPEERYCVNGRFAPRGGAFARLIAALDEAINTAATEDDAYACHDLLVLAHPFSDGNGRTARLLCNAVRVRLGLAWLMFPSQDRRRYHARMGQIAEASGEWLPVDNDTSL